MITAPLLPFIFANKFSIIAINDENDKLIIYFTNKTPLSAISETCRELSWNASFCKLSMTSFQAEITKVYKSAAGDFQGIENLNLSDLGELLEEKGKVDLLDSQDDAPVIKLINALFTQALKKKASDIHIESFETQMSVRFRIDGVLQEMLKPDYRWAPKLISRIKVMAKLDIAERRIPQDGRVSLTMAGQDLDVRVSTLPSIHGERVVLRLLEKEAQRLDRKSVV